MTRIWYAVLTAGLVALCALAVLHGRAQAQSVGLGALERNLTELADQKPAEFVAAVKAAATDPNVGMSQAQLQAFRDALIAEAFPQRTYTQDEEHVEKWESLYRALAPFQGKTGTAFEGMDQGALFRELRQRIEVAPQPE